MPRAKRASDERYNARRRAKRELARIERNIAAEKYMPIQEQVMKDYAARLRKSIENSYIQKDIVRGMDKKARRRLTSKADAALKSSESALESLRLSRTATERENRAFAEKLNRAKHGEKTDISGLDELSVQFFYVSTKRLWTGRRLSERNKAIMEYLGTNSLEEAYRVVMAKNREYIQGYRTFRYTIENFGYSVDGWTNENKWFYEDMPEMIEDDRYASPTWVYFF